MSQLRRSLGMRSSEPRTDSAHSAISGGVDHGIGDL